MEVVGFVGTDRHKGSRHRKAVYVAAYRTVHVGKLVDIEVVAGGEGEIPVLGRAYVAIET